MLRLPSYCSENQWKQLRSYAQTKDPIRIAGLGKVKVWPLRLHKSSTFNLLHSVSFEYVRQEPPASSENRPDAAFKTLCEVNQMRTLDGGFEEVSIKGVVSFGSDELEGVPKKDGTTGFIKHDSVIESGDQLVQLRLWE